MWILVCSERIGGVELWQFVARRSYICVVHENLHDREIYKVLSTSAKQSCHLFGPKQIVEEDAQGRYRSWYEFCPC
jgi:hypothetical protein